MLIDKTRYYQQVSYGIYSYKKLRYNTMSYSQQELNEFEKLGQMITYKYGLGIKLNMIAETVKIHKSEDEWFFIELYDKRTLYDFYFIADQISGVFEFLNDLNDRIIEFKMKSEYLISI